MDRGRRARSGKINNSLEIESCADKNCFFFDFAYFCSFFNKILGCYGKTDISILGIFVRFSIKFWAFMEKRGK